MFANFIVRVREADPAAASIAAHRFLDEAGGPNNAFTLLLLCSYLEEDDAGLGDEGLLEQRAPLAEGLRVVLVSSNDWQRRDREATRLRDELATRGDVIRLAQRIRFHDLFLRLGVRRSRGVRAIYERLEEDYLASVHDPAEETRFLEGTSRGVRAILALAGVAPSDDLRRREAIAERLRAATTARSYPFVEGRRVGLHEARVFDLGGRGPEHYVVASVHL